MFGFLFSWFIGQWGPKSSCTKPKHSLTPGFLIPLLMSFPNSGTIPIITVLSQMAKMEELLSQHTFADSASYKNTLVLNNFLWCQLLPAPTFISATWSWAVTSPRKVLCSIRRPTEIATALNFRLLVCCAVIQGGRVYEPVVFVEEASCKSR